MQGTGNIRASSHLACSTLPYNTPKSQLSIRLMLFQLLLALGAQLLRCLAVVLDSRR